MIRKISSIKEILNSKADVFFFDIEDTVLVGNVFYELIGQSGFGEIFLDICGDLKVSEVMSFGRNYKRILTESCIPGVINTLKSRGKFVFALTSGFHSRHKKEKLLSLGVKFDGFLFTRRTEKGPFLNLFLTTNLKNQAKMIAFVDNHKAKLLSVEQHVTCCDLDLFHYVLIKTPKVTKESFVNYWTSVVGAIKNGALDDLRERIQMEKEQKYTRKRNRPVSKCETDEKVCQAFANDDFFQEQEEFVDE